MWYYPPLSFFRPRRRLLRAHAPPRPFDPRARPTARAQPPRLPFAPNRAGEGSTNLVLPSPSLFLLVSLYYEYISVVYNNDVCNMLILLFFWDNLFKMKSQ